MKQYTFTDWQVKWLIKVLKNYINLRKSHFISVEGGMKREKITEELVLVQGLIEYLSK